MTARTIACHREDGEHVGFLSPRGGQWVPMTTFGCPLTEPTDRDTAEATLQAIGLSCLIEPWQFLEAGDWVRVNLVEAQPDHVTVQFSDYDRLDLHGRLRTVTPPMADRLRLAR